MAFAFVGQPFADFTQMGDILRAALLDEKNRQAWFLAAWGKQSGLSRLAIELRAFRERGGTAKAVVGVDEGGATVEGLTLAAEFFDEVWVFHDPGVRTFHPKLYVVSGDASTEVLVGSSNLTKGGLFTNYEAAVHLTLQADSEDDQKFLSSVLTYFELLIASKAALPLDEHLIARLENDSRLLVLSEQDSNARRARRRKSETEDSVFGSNAVGGLLGAPPPALEIPEDSEDDDDALLEKAKDHVSGEGAVSGNSEQPAIQGFFKALSGNDVSLKDSPGQIIIPIAFLPFFGELEVQKDEKSSGGPSQSHREFPLVYRREGVETKVKTGRVILYEPAALHKRQNNEARFTFRDRQILESLKKDDVLVFERNGGTVAVEHRPAEWRPAGIAASTRFGLI